jgi:hypothetical protein
MLVPTTAWIRVVSVVRRDSTSPVRVVSKNSGLLAGPRGVDRAADVGGDALAQPGHHVEARRGGHAQHRGDPEQGQEGGVDVAMLRAPAAAPKPWSIICLKA